MPILRSGTRVVFFSHIPKTGGSSVESYLRSKGSLSFCTDRSAPESLRVTPQHLHRAEIDRLFAPNLFDASFAVLRDPVARLLSEYRWRASKPRGTALKRHPGLRRRLSRLHPALRGADLSFDAWVPVIFDAWLADPYVLDNHIRPQAEFVAGCDRLFALEKGLDPVFDWIDERTDTAPGERDLWLKRSGSGVDTVSAGTRRRIETFYARDMELHAALL